MDTNIRTETNRAGALFVGLALVVIAFMLLPGRVAAQADPATVVEAFAEAINSGDVDAAVALFAEDGVIENPNRRFVGLAEIRGDLQAQVDQGINMTNVSVEVSGSSVMVIQEIRQPRIEAFGIERIIRIATFEIRDGKIVSLAAMPDTSDPDTARFVASQGPGGGAGPAGPPPAGPEALPDTGSGGLADNKSGSAWFALSLAAGLAALVLLGGVGGRVVVRRRR